MEQLPKIKTILSCAGIPIFGCCPFEPLRPQILECRAKERLPADAKSIFVALFPYAMEEAAYQGGNLSRYAAVGDYHEIVPQYLKRAVSALEQAFPEEAFVPFTDNFPNSGVRAAALAGLGRIGQNGLLIHERYGSWVFIGEIVNNAANRRPAASNPPLHWLWEVYLRLPHRRIDRQGAGSIQMHVRSDATKRLSQRTGSRSDPPLRLCMGL